MHAIQPSATQEETYKAYSSHLTTDTTTTQLATLIGRHLHFAKNRIQLYLTLYHFHEAADDSKSHTPLLTSRTTTLHRHVTVHNFTHVYLRVLPKGATRPEKPPTQETTTLRKRPTARCTTQQAAASTELHIESTTTTSHGPLHSTGYPNEPPRERTTYTPADDTNKRQTLTPSQEEEPPTPTPDTISDVTSHTSTPPLQQLNRCITQVVALQRLPVIIEKVKLGGGPSRSTTSRGWQHQCLKLVSSCLSSLVRV
eukprot:6463468-Amphidinium_carterae.3